MSLIAHLQQIPEFRAAQSQRHELWFVLLLIILGAMMGYWGLPPISRIRRDLRQRGLPDPRPWIRHEAAFVLNVASGDATVRFQV